MKHEQKNFFTHNVLITREVSKLLRVSEEYVRELIRQQKIRAYQEGRRGGYRILRKDVDVYIEHRLEKHRHK